METPDRAGAWSDTSTPRHGGPSGVNPADAKLASGEWRPAPAVFPMVLGVDGAGVVETVGNGTTRFRPGDRVFGQLFIPPIGASGTYAEYVAVTAEAPLARVPDGVDLAMAAAAPTAGLTGLSLVELLEPLDDQVVLIVGAGGGVGTFATQFAVNAGARVIANIDAQAEGRMRAYGVTETVLRSEVPVKKAVRQSHPDGIDALIDLVSDAESLRLQRCARPPWWNRHHYSVRCRPRGAASVGNKRGELCIACRQASRWRESGRLSPIGRSSNHR